jgi:hypothetical protein
VTEAQQEVLSSWPLFIVLGLFLLFLLKIATYQKNKKSDPNIINKDFVPKKLPFGANLVLIFTHGSILYISILTVGLLFYLAIIFFSSSH